MYEVPLIFKPSSFLLGSVANLCDQIELNVKSFPSLEIPNRQIPNQIGHWQLIKQAWVLCIDSSHRKMPTAGPSHETDADKAINSFLLAELLDFYFSLVSSLWKCLMFPKQLLSEPKQGGYQLNFKD